MGRRSTRGVKRLGQNDPSCQLMLRFVQAVGETEHWFNLAQPKVTVRAVEGLPGFVTLEASGSPRHAKFVLVLHHGLPVGGLAVFQSFVDEGKKKTLFLTPEALRKLAKHRHTATPACR